MMVVLNGRDVCDLHLTRETKPFLSLGEVPSPGPLDRPILAAEGKIHLSQLLARPRDTGAQIQMERRPVDGRRQAHQIALLGLCTAFPGAFAKAVCDPLQVLEALSLKSNEHIV